MEDERKGPLTKLVECALVHFGEPSVEPPSEDKGSGGRSWVSRPWRKAAAGDQTSAVLTPG